MQTLTELVAAGVVHSSAVAYAHFGVPVEAHQVEKPVVAEPRTVARSTQSTKPVAMSEPAPARAAEPKARPVRT